VTRAPLRILGIDPGLNRTGWGVIEAEGQRLQAIASGVIRIPAGELAPRLAVILRELAEVIALHTPRLAVVERVFVNTNPQSTLLLGQARGAALCAAVQAGLDVHEYSALQVKQAVVGTGRAEKAQMQMMVTRLLALDAEPATDAADALACAICHAHASRLLTVLGGAPALRARRSASGRRAWRIRGARLANA
jgi:crossover junction endodeoxyribonuclease RuvC